MIRKIGVSILGIGLLIFGIASVCSENPHSGSMVPVVMEPGVALIPVGSEPASLMGKVELLGPHKTKCRIPKGVIMLYEREHRTLLAYTPITTDETYFFSVLPEGEYIAVLRLSEKNSKPVHAASAKRVEKEMRHELPQHDILVGPEFAFASPEYLSTLQSAFAKYGDPISSHAIKISVHPGKNTKNLHLIVP